MSGEGNGWASIIPITIVAIITMSIVITMSLLTIKTDIEILLTRVVTFLIIILWRWSIWVSCILLSWEISGGNCLVLNWLVDFCRFRDWFIICSHGRKWILSLRYQLIGS